MYERAIQCENKTLKIRCQILEDENQELKERLDELTPKQIPELEEDEIESLKSQVFEKQAIIDDLETKQIELQLKLHDLILKSHLQIRDDYRGKFTLPFSITH